MRLLPEAGSGREGINRNLPPPAHFVTAAVDLPMVATAERDGEFVANLAAECRVLSKAQVMRISGPPAAHETRLPSHEFHVLLVSQPPRLRQG